MNLVRSRAMLAVCGALLAAPATAAAQVDFVAVQDIAAEGTTIVAGDFDGDGRPDVALASGPLDAVAVLLDDDAGGLRPPGYIPMGDDVRDVAIGDFDGDGHDDLAAVNATPGTLTVRPGNGAGGFGAPVPRPAGPFPVWVKAADLDGDGDDDLVVSNGNADNSDLSVFFSDGAGGFAPPQVHPTTFGQNPTRAAIGDVDDDGRLDIVAVTSGPGSFQVLLGVPGGFVPGPLRGANGFSLALEDLTGDGNLDAITSVRDAGIVQVLQGDGTGAFGATGGVVNVPAGAIPLGVTVADVSGDGEADVITADRGLPGVFVLLGTGAGTGTDVFAGTFSFPVDGMPTETVAADFDRDGRLDLAVVDASRRVVLLRNTETSYASVVLADDPVSYYRFGEASGPVARDATGRNPGRYRGGAFPGAEGQIAGDSAVRLDGRTGGVRAPDSRSLDTGDSFSLEVWARPSGDDTGELFTKGYHLVLDGAGHVVLRKPNVGRIARTQLPISDTDRFHHIVATKDGRQVRLYVDGAEDTGRVVNRRITDTAGPLHIGLGARPFAGVLDEAAIYDRALTPEEVRRHYLAGF